MSIKVFEWHSASENWAAFCPLSYADHERALLFVSGQKGLSSGSIEFRRVGDKKPLSDNPLCGIPGAILVSKSALENLSYLREMGMPVSVSLPDADPDSYCLLKITSVVDCFDNALGRIDGLRDVYFFDSRRVPTRAAFMLPEHLARVFVDGDLVADVKRSGLTGFEFVELWDSEKGGKKMVLDGQRASLEWVG